MLRSTLWIKAKRLCEFPHKPTAAQVAEFEEPLCSSRSWECEPPSVVLRVLSIVSQSSCGFPAKVVRAAHRTIVNIAPTLSLGEAQQLFGSLQAMKIRFAMPMQEVLLLPPTFFACIDLSKSIEQFGDAMDAQTCVAILNCHNLALSTKDRLVICSKLEGALRRSVPSFDLAVATMKACSIIYFDTSSLLKACYFVLDSLAPSLNICDCCVALRLIESAPERPFLLQRRLMKQVASHLSESNLFLENVEVFSILQLKELPTDLRLKVVSTFNSSLKMADLEFHEVMILSSIILTMCDQSMVDLLCARMFSEISNASLEHCNGLLHDLSFAVDRGLAVSFEFVARVKLQFYNLYLVDKDDERALSYLECFLTVCTENSVSPFSFDDVRRLIMLQKECMECFWRTSTPQFLHVVNLLKSVDALYLPFSQL